MAIDELAYERIARYVETAYPAARPVGTVRGVTRPRSFELEDGDQTHFFLTFVVDKLSSITHRCIEVLEPGDRLLATTPDGDDVYEGELREEVLGRLKAAEPDRDNGSHHVSPEALNSGQLIFRTRAGPLEVPVRVISAGTATTAPPSDFWATCAQLVEVYPSRPPKISREAEAFRVSRQLGTMLEPLADALVPSAFWQGSASVGQGQWADVPWCAVFDSRETITAQKGVYPVIHFLIEPSPGIRIGVGVSLTEYRDEARARSREVAEQLTADAWDALARRGYARTPDLAASAQATRLDYKRGMVFAKFVPLGDIRSRSAELSIDLATALRVYKDWVSRHPRGAALDPEQERVQSHFGLDWLAHSTYWTDEALSEVLAAIQHRSPQILLAGPPGTGKSWVAERLAEHLTDGRKDRWRIVQFHPSYSYEQFVEGLRPVARDGAIHFEIAPGHLRQFVRDMNGPDPHVLILDEMNRANLPRVLGELMYLFEYRDKAIDLSYTKDFKLPRNLLFIGTMNTADRSIRSIDIALRRRFDVFECRPDRGILERYYASEHSNTVPMLFEGFEALNGELERVLDRHRTIGHTFFMHSDMTPELLRRVWTYKVFPIIEEYLFDQPDVARTFTLGRFWTAV